MEIKLDYLFCIVAIALLSTMLHEIAHAAVANWQGDATARLKGRISLNPLKHIDPFMSILLPVALGLMGVPIFGGAKPVPINTRNLKHGEWSFALVAIAGPLTNFILAFIFYIIGANIGGGNEFLNLFLTVGILLNIGYCLFNIIPIPPLDGSRVLYAFAPDFVRGIMDMIERKGIIVIYVVILLFGSLLDRYFDAGTDIILDLFELLVGK